MSGERLRELWLRTSRDESAFLAGWTHALEQVLAQGEGRPLGVAALVEELTAPLAEGPRLVELQDRIAALRGPLPPTDFAQPAIPERWEERLKRVEARANLARAILRGERDELLGG